MKVGHASGVNEMFLARRILFEKVKAMKKDHGHILNEEDMLLLNTLRQTIYKAIEWKWWQRVNEWLMTD